MLCPAPSNGCSSKAMLLRFSTNFFSSKTATVTSTDAHYHARPHIIVVALLLRTKQSPQIAPQSSAPYARKPKPAHAPPTNTTLYLTHYILKPNIIPRHPISATAYIIEYIPKNQFTTLPTLAPQRTYHKSTILA